MTQHECIWPIAISKDKITFSATVAYWLRRCIT